MQLVKRHFHQRVSLLLFSQNITFVYDTVIVIRSYTFEIDYFFVGIYFNGSIKWFKMDIVSMDNFHQCIRNPLYSKYDSTGSSKKDRKSTRLNSSHVK